jgi:SAM-dependent methyltransferase
MFKKIQSYAASWESNAAADSFYSILTDSAKRGRWDTEEFLATGEEEISRVFAFMEHAGITLSSNERFLDFGCGVGRLSKALMSRFRSGIGVDISSRMIEQARKLNTDCPALEFIVNQKLDLKELPKVDFVYSHIVLQHMPNEHQEAFIKEFLRLLTPGGVAAFQIPTAWVGLDLVTTIKWAMPFWLKRWIKRGARQVLGRGGFEIEMHTLSNDRIERLLEGFSILASPFTNSTDPDHHGRIVFFSESEARRRISSEGRSVFLSRFFFVRKDAHG